MTILVLDGGLSSQIEKRIGSRVDGDPLWSSRFLVNNPEDVIATHLDFLRAGSEVITTNTYQAWIGGFIKYLNLTSEASYDLIKYAVQLAKTARDTYVQEVGDILKKVPLIAGSVGSYGAHLHDGSEYDGSFADTTTKETMREWHKPRIDALIEGGVDLLAIETVPCLKEAETLVEMIKEYPATKAWISFSCKDDKSLAHGESFKDVAVQCWRANPEQLLAVGVNCCSPKNISNLIRDINHNKQDFIPLVVYPNSGEKYDPKVGWVQRDQSEALESFVFEWLDLGVCFIGGCCRTYAEDIVNIKSKVKEWENIKH